MRETTGGREDGKSGGNVLPAVPSSRRPVWHRLRSAFKQIVGMPDYARYLEHHAARHPECAVPSEREFYEQYLAARYGNGASRCC